RRGDRSRASESAPRSGRGATFLLAGRSATAVAAKEGQDPRRVPLPRLITGRFEKAPVGLRVTGRSMSRRLKTTPGEVKSDAEASRSLLRWHFVGDPARPAGWRSPCKPTLTIHI